jgi:predicted DCC family thiol-disulfide oxidoreductase YuxK
VYFNGDCPVCSREIGAYARHADKRSLPLRFTDSMRTPEALREFGLRIEHLERRLYLRDEQGRIVSGFRAVLALWARMPRYRVLAHLFGFPPLRAACEFLYDHAVAPSLAAWGRARAGRPPYPNKYQTK